MPKVLESLGPGAIQILDFRFRILDLKIVAPLSPKYDPVSIRNPNSKIQNPLLTDSFARLELDIGDFE